MIYLNQKGLSQILFLLLAIIALVAGGLFLKSRENNTQIKSPTKSPQKVFELPQDLPQNIQGKILYLKTGEKGADQISFPQILDFQNKSLSDKFNNSPFIRFVQGSVVPIEWSPDGSKFVEVALADKSGNHQVYLYDLVKIYELAKKDDLSSYGPTPIKPKKSGNITEGVRVMSWSPNGDGLALWEERKEVINGMNTFSAQLVRLTWEPQPNELEIFRPVSQHTPINLKPKWSPDESKILFVEIGGTAPGSQSVEQLSYVTMPNLDKVVVIPAGKDERAYLDNFKSYEWVNNEEIMVTQNNKGTYVYNINTNKSKEIVAENDSVSYQSYLAPDKKSLALLISNGIEVMDLNSNLTLPAPQGKDYNYSERLKKFFNDRPTFVELPDGFTFSSYPSYDIFSWSPDSKFAVITLKSKNSDANSIEDNSIFIFDRESKKFIRLPQLEGAFSPKWAP